MQSANDYIFSEDWFSSNISTWENTLYVFANKPNLNFLEIGSYQGRSAVWLMENILTHPSSKLTCIDTFEGDDYYTNAQKYNIEGLFDHNTSRFASQITKLKGNSLQHLKQLNEQYDFIYIDGDHRAKGILQDAILAHQLLKKNGIMIFDDYEGGDYINEPDKYPKYAVDTFVHFFKDEYIIVNMGYQMILQKM